MKKIQEEKELLLQDLRARLPYGVKILHEGWNFEWDDELSTVERVVGIDEDFIYTKVIDTHNGEEYRDDKYPIDTFDDKLFLRPMSSMTDEEEKEFENQFLCKLKTNEKRGYSIVWNNGLSIDFATFRLIDIQLISVWLDKKMFDWRRIKKDNKRISMIEAGLAIEAPEGMYD